MDTRQMIRAYINENFLFSTNGFRLSDDDSFLETGVVDSMGIMEPVLFVEEQFGIQVADEDVVPGNFDSVNCLAVFIESKAGAND